MQIKFVDEVGQEALAATDHTRTIERVWDLSDELSDVRVVALDQLQDVHIYALPEGWHLPTQACTCRSQRDRSSRENAAHVDSAGGMVEAHNQQHADQH